MKMSHTFTDGKYIIFKVGSRWLLQERVMNDCYNDVRPFRTLKAAKEHIKILRGTTK